MREFQKHQLLDIITSLHTIHRESRQSLEQKEYQTVMAALSDCQEAAIQMGEAIEKIEGEGTEAVSCLERYCENLYDTSVRLEKITSQKFYKNLEETLIKVENALKHMPVRIEAVFLPYKASMWDSLESVWMAADADPVCDAYVIPIPYYDKNPDGSFKTEHYEADQFPEYVPVTRYDAYDFEQHRPDMIFIHNPYDQYNHVTSVHPFFYSQNLKKYTEELVYIPYYATSGGMSEAQGFCPAYYFVDHIVIQAEKYRKYFDPVLQADKLLPLGSPKFDRVVRICNNPPQPPAEWKEKMAGKTVYFFNTSLNGLLANTQGFLKKMKYVFDCFERREDACLLWRPHPLLESTLDSMRPEYRTIFEALRTYFIEKNLGIYDTTPDITNTIALCDAYIGDESSSVTALFGVVGKPLFILNNFINTLPEADDWRGEVIRGFDVYGDDRWLVTQGNKLYYSPEGNYQYRYFCDLCEYAYGFYYSYAITIGGLTYICPRYAQDILIVGEKGIRRRIALSHELEKGMAFYGAIACDRYLYLIPFQYPALVRYDTLNGEITYFTDHLDIFVQMVDGERRMGGYCFWKGYLFLASPVDNKVLAVHAETGKMQVMTTGAEHARGCMALIPDGDDLWFLPIEGTDVVRWNPESGEMREYRNVPQGFECKHPILGYECADRPFNWAACCRDYVYLSQGWGNMNVRLDKQTGEMTAWKPPFEQPAAAKNGYYFSWSPGCFCSPFGEQKEHGSRMFSARDRRFYEVDFETEEYSEIKVEFDAEELREQEPGFWEISEWLRYACQEDAFNSLKDFLDGSITGAQHDRERQLRAFEAIAANHDGSSGAKIYGVMQKKLLES